MRGLRAFAAGACLIGAVEAGAQTAVPPPPPIPSGRFHHQLQLLFDTDSSVPIAAHRPWIVDDLASFLAEAEDFGIELWGHADRAGTREHNQRLSCRRAQWVRDALIARGVGADRIAVSAYGEDRPTVATEDGVADFANRRVETILTQDWRYFSGLVGQRRARC